MVPSMVSSNKMADLEAGLRNRFLKTMLPVAQLDYAVQFAANEHPLVPDELAGTPQAVESQGADRLSKSQEVSENAMNDASVLT